MPSFEQYKAEYAENWAKLQMRPDRAKSISAAAARLIAGKPRYLECQRRTGVPWWFFGLCHLRESSFKWDTYLGNGQPLSRVTTIVPKGRGPFSTFEDGAVDAMDQMGFSRMKDWSLPRTAYRLEGFNGYGYHNPKVRGTAQPLGHPVPSPYIYGGSTVYVKGKYTRDHYFDPDFVDTQLGTLVVLKRVMEMDSSVRFENAAGATPATKAATQIPVVVGGAVATGAAVASGWSWPLIASLVILVALIIFIVWYVLRGKPDEDAEGLPTVELNESEKGMLLQENRK